MGKQFFNAHILQQRPRLFINSDGEIDTLLDKLDATADPSINDDSDDGYAVGSLWVNVTTDKAFICLDSSVGSAVWKEITTSVVDGDHVVSEGISTTSGTGWTEKLNLPTFTPISDGDYEVHWNWEQNCNAKSHMHMRVMQDDTTELGQNLKEAVTVNDYEHVSGFAIITLTVAGGPYRFDIDFASPDTDLVRIRRARLAVCRLP